MLPVQVTGPLDTLAWADLDARGCPGVAVAVKAGFRAGDGALLRLDEQAPVLEVAERCPRDPAERAPLCAPECVPFKQGCDFLLHGAVQPHPGRSQALASLGVEDAGGRRPQAPKRVWAVGEPPLSDHGSPRPLVEPVPLSYELA